MTAEQMKQNGFNVFMLPTAEAVKEHRALMEASGVVFEFEETVELVGMTMLHVLGAKRLTPTLKQQLSAADIKKHVGFPKGD